MSSYNRVILMGNLTRDPELRTIGSGSVVCEIGLAVNRKYKTQSGEMREEVTFVDISVWGTQGENLQRWKHKGDPLLVEGRLKFDSWQAQDGSRRSKLTVVGERVTYLSRGGGGDNRPNDGYQQQGGGGYQQQGGGGYQQQGGGGYQQPPQHQGGGGPPQQQPSYGGGYQAPAPAGDPFADQRGEPAPAPAGDFNEPPVREDDVPF